MGSPGNKCFLAIGTLNMATLTGDGAWFMSMRIWPADMFGELRIVFVRSSRSSSRKLLGRYSSSQQKPAPTVPYAFSFLQGTPANSAERPPKVKRHFRYMRTSGSLTSSISCLMSCGLGTINFAIFFCLLVYEVISYNYKPE